MTAIRCQQGLRRQRSKRATATLLGSFLALTATGCASDEDDGHVDIDDSEPDPAPDAGKWPQYRLEPTHAGVAPSGTRVGPELELIWSSEPLAIGDYSASKSSPSIADGTVYIGIDDGQLHALDATNGEIKWSFKTHIYEVELNRPEDENNRGIHGTAAVYEDKVFIGDYLGWLYALDVETGDLIWETDLGGSIGASPALYQGYVFMAVEYGSPDGKIHVVYAEDGTVVYETPYLGNHPHSSVTIDPKRNYMFVGANNGHFFCFDFVNEELVWEYEMDLDPGDEKPGDIKSTAAVHEDTVYITSWDHKMHAIDIDSGERVFAFETEARSMSSPSYHDGRVYFGSHDGSLYSVDAESGAEIWSFATERAVMSSPTIVPDTGVAVIGSNDGHVYMVDVASGDEVWSYEVDGVLSSVPVATGDSLYLYDASGTVWRFDVQG